MMINTCRHCQARMSAYVNGEVSPQVRRRMARHLHTCSRCYAVYQRESQLRNLLERDLPPFGVAGRTQLSAIWVEVRAELTQHKTAVRRPSQHIMRYGFVVALMLVVMFLPMALYDEAVSVTVPAPALPEITDTTMAGVERTGVNRALENASPIGTAVASSLGTLEIVRYEPLTDTPPATTTTAFQPPLIPVPSVTAPDNALP